MTGKMYMYMMSYYISLHGFINYASLQSSDAWFTSLIPSRLALCNAHHICLYYFHWFRNSQTRKDTNINLKQRFWQKI